MLKTIIGFNESAVNQDGQLESKLSAGFIIARLMYFGAGMLTGNMLEPFDRIRKGLGKKQLDGKDTAPALSFKSTPATTSVGTLA